MFPRSISLFSLQSILIVGTVVVWWGSPSSIVVEGKPQSLPFPHNNLWSSFIKNPELSVPPPPPGMKWEYTSTWSSVDYGNGNSGYSFSGIGSLSGGHSVVQPAQNLAYFMTLTFTFLILIARNWTAHIHL